MRVGQLLREAAWPKGRSRHYFISTAAQAAGVAVVGIVAARELGPSGRGVVSLLLTASVLAGAATTLGLELSLGRAAASRATMPNHLGRYLLLTAALGMVGGIALGAAFLELSDVHADDSLLAVTGLASGFGGSYTVMNGVLVGLGASSTVLTSRVAGALLSVVLAVALVEGPGDEAAAIASLAAGFSLTLVLQVAYGRAAARHHPRATEVPSAIMKAGLKVHAGTILQALTYRIDLVIVGALIGAGNVGVYSVAVSLAVLLWFLPDALAATVLQDAAADRGVNSAILERASRSALLGGGIAAGGLAAIGWLLIPAVFGDSYARAYEALLLLLPGGVVIGLWKVHATYAFARGQDMSKLRGAALGAVLTVVLDLVLIPRLGINGAAVGASLAYAVVTTEGIWEVKRMEPRMPLRTIVGGFLRPRPATEQDAW